MQVLVFKTNIRYKNSINKVSKYIQSIPGIIKWNVDLHDIDKILRIETTDLQPVMVENMIHSAGYQCEELKD